LPKFLLVLWIVAAGADAQPHGTIRGVVLDTSRAALPSATVTLRNRQTSPDDTGSFGFVNVPFGAWQLTAAAPGFQTSVQTVRVASPEPIEVSFSLTIARSSTSIDVSDARAERLELTATARGTLDRMELDRLPVENQATGLSEVVTRTTPGVASDGNGFAHPLGEHADTSISIDHSPSPINRQRSFRTSYPPRSCRRWRSLPAHLPLSMAIKPA
jgi:hypothetical protein